MRNTRERSPKSRRAGAEKLERETTSAAVPAGMSVFSVRLPTADIAAMRARVDTAAGSTVSDLVRQALAAYLEPVGPWAALSIAGQGEATLWTGTPLWTGGRAHPPGVVTLEVMYPQGDPPG